MEFFVAGGDAAESLELGEEVFDAVTLAIEVLVKGRFLRSAGVHGYDGDAAELVHISADGVAVVALVHDDEGRGLEPRLEQWLALIEVRDVGPGENEAQGIAERIAGQMNLGREAGLGTSHGVSELTTNRSGSVLVHSSTGAVDHQILVIAMEGADGGEQSLPQSVADGASEVGIYALPSTEAAGQITPRRSGAQDPKDRFQSQPLIRAFTPTPLRASQGVLMAINFLSSFQCSSLRTNLICWFTG